MVSIILFVRFKNEFLLQVSGLKFKAHWSYLSIYKNYILLLLLSMQLLLKAFFSKRNFLWFYISFVRSSYPGSVPLYYVWKLYHILEPALRLFQIFTRPSPSFTSVCQDHFNSNNAWHIMVKPCNVALCNATPRNNKPKKRCLKIKNRNRKFNFPFSHILVHPHQSAKSYLTLFSVQFL